MTSRYTLARIPAIIVNDLDSTVVARERSTQAQGRVAKIFQEQASRAPEKVAEVFVKAEAKFWKEAETITEKRFQA